VSGTASAAQIRGGQRDRHHDASRGCDDGPVVVGRGVGAVRNVQRVRSRCAVRAGRGATTGKAGLHGLPGDRRVPRRCPGQPHRVRCLGWYDGTRASRPAQTPAQCHILAGAVRGRPSSSGAFRFLSASIPEVSRGLVAREEVSAGESAHDSLAGERLAHRTQTHKIVDVL